MMPYLVPEAHMPMTCRAPRLAARKASLVMQTNEVLYATVHEGELEITKCDFKSG